MTTEQTQATPPEPTAETPAASSAPQVVERPTTQPDRTHQAPDAAGLYTPPLAGDNLHGLEPDNAHCPSCLTGLLYPIAWDAEATHEQGENRLQNLTQQVLEPSGGAAIYRCFLCGYQASQPLGGER